MTDGLQGPAATVDVVRKLVQNAGAPFGEDGGSVTETKAEVEETQKDSEADKEEPQDATNASDGTTNKVEEAEVAAQVADTAEKLDGDAVV